MNDTLDSDYADPGRRRLLAGVLTAYTVSLIPWAVAAPVSSQSEGVFLALSAMLVGRRSLETSLAIRLHAALTATSPNFDADAQELLGLIDAEHIDPTKLQARLETLRSPLGSLPPKIMRAWCLGLVGEGDSVRCIAYEEALNAQFVSDVLKPPTYAYGRYGSWSKPPLANGADDNENLG